MTPESQGVNRMLDLNETREFRSALGKIIREIDEFGSSRESALAKTKLQEAKMWLGMHMGKIGGEDLNAKRDKEILSNK